jgi:VWFA-related protein
MFLQTRSLFICLILLSGFLSTPTLSHGKSFDEGIRIDVPADGRVHVENKFGDVNAEVWSNPYVSVAVSFADAGTASKRSPILIDNRGKYLAISVFRVPADPPAVVNLSVKLPITSHLEVVTVSGRISLHGLSASASLKSNSGDIESFIPTTVDANISARAPKGTVTSSVASTSVVDPHFLQARLGTGANQLDAQTQTGRIQFSSQSTSATLNRPSATQPRLIGERINPGGAGTPATSESGELNEGDVIRVDSQLVSLNMSVVDVSTNRGVIGLSQSDFRLFEDGEEQSIVQFESSAAPFDLVLLIDVSGSTKEKTKLMRSAALRFVNAARPADRIGIITFAGAPTVVSKLTADRELLRQRVEAIDTARGDTKLYDAAMFATNEFLKESKRTRRTAVVLMSDGLDGTIPGVSDQIGSQTSYREMLDQLQEFDGVFYTLWLNTRYVALNPRDTQPEAFDEAFDRMREMAEAGGGIFYEVQRLEDLAGAYERVVADLGTVYSLAYRPANKSRDGKWRAIRVRVNRSNAIARGKRGYYAN